MVNITDIRINLMSENVSNLKAIASITLDGCFVIHGLRIMESPDGKEFVTMPQTKLKDGTFKDIVHPLNSETRRCIANDILDAYHYYFDREEQ